MGIEEPLRDRLVTAGVELLEESGVAQLGLRSIARRAGVSHGAPRRYFPTHAALLSAIAARGFADLRAGFEAHAGQPPRARVERMTADYVRFAAARPEMFALMFRHDLLEGSGERLRHRTLPLYREFTDLVAACAPGDTDRRALELWVGVHGTAVLVANRSLALVAPGADPLRLAADLVERHLGPGR
ncbi:TetR/AcrR family transcriptional regulator [Nocardia blacklockiae]|uniref:TetR/AcrR family transcriptional regulator n=1 Tax=Nocardia blacklockiae TaxID=480036 RepID=UPI00189420D1|nr:TetR/AcrR family transcriptional regulator [Nocardia blacklockiae]MBF6170225.1 TetR/AcrR family transcriptional regulator [Nocardia blacklockiae]